MKGQPLSARKGVAVAAALKLTPLGEQLIRVYRDFDEELQAARSNCTPLPEQSDQE
jgi:hypothetical protein